MKSIKLTKEEKETRKVEGFSDFFHNASDEEKKRVLLEAAKRANEDQQEVFRQANLKLNN